MQTKTPVTLLCNAVFRVFLLVMLLVVWAAGSLSVAQARQGGSLPQLATPRQPVHYIVFEKSADGTVTPVYYRLVQLDAPLPSITAFQVAAALAVPSREADQLAVSLQDAAGQVVYRNVIQVSPWLRGEFRGQTPGAPIDGHLIPLKKVSFVVRVPQIAGTTLVLQNERLESIGTFATDQLAGHTPAIRLNPSIELQDGLLGGGPAGNREDLLVMGDGYTAAQQSQFISDASAVTTEFFAIPPYSIYQNYYNLHTLFTASNQSGADHPPYNPDCNANDPSCCSDPEMLGDALQGTMVDTAFDSRFCTAGIHRLLSADDSKVLAAAAAVPDWDSILVLVNDPTYGGSGGTVAAISMEASAPQIAQHEYGHSFVHLADEYESPYPGYPSCSDTSGSSPCEPNVTNQTSRSLIKWKLWINSRTPIPTPNNPIYDGLVGLFRGARYLSSGMYRPGYDCIMRSLGMPYCQVPSQAFVLRLYQDINLIEPGSLSPAGANLHLARPATQVLRASILSPVGGPHVQIVWLKNGVVIPGAHSTSYTFTTNSATPALTHLTVRVTDLTTLVRPAGGGGALQNQFTWNIHADVQTLTYRSVAVNDGTVLESSENSGVGGSKNNTSPAFKLGDDAANRQYRAILSFDTSSLPDNAVITRATLKIKRQGLVGVDPFTTNGSLLADIRKPFFGASAGLAVGDFQAAATAVGSAIFGATPLGGWYSAPLYSPARPLINRTGTTQFRLAFTLDDNNDSLANSLSFYSGDAPAADRPVLIIDYYLP